MDTTQIGAYNTKILRSLGIIAENENLLKRAAKYLRRLAKEQMDSTLMSEEEFFQMLDQAEEVAKNGKVTRLQPGSSTVTIVNQKGPTA